MKAFKFTSLLTAGLLLGSGSALAHPGHGNPVAHMHSSPAVWFVGAVISVFALVKLGQFIASKRRSLS